MNKFDIDYIKNFIEAHPTAKIYIGSDSQRIKKKRVKFAVVVVVHYNGCNGAKVFADISYEDVSDAKLSRPFNRMMAEVQKLTELYEKLEAVIWDKDFEVHLDVNPDKNAGSNVAFAAARGMILGLIGVEPVVKPDAWCASSCADKWSK